MHNHKVQQTENSGTETNLAQQARLSSQPFKCGFLPPDWRFPFAGMTVSSTVANSRPMPGATGSHRLKSAAGHKNHKFRSPQNHKMPATYAGDLFSQFPRFLTASQGEGAKRMLNFFRFDFNMLHEIPSEASVSYRNRLAILTD